MGIFDTKRYRLKKTRCQRCGELIYYFTNIKPCWCKKCESVGNVEIIESFGDWMKLPKFIHTVYFIIAYLLFKIAWNSYVLLQMTDELSKMGTWVAIAFYFGCLIYVSVLWAGHNGWFGNLHVHICYNWIRFLGLVIQKDS